MSKLRFKDLLLLYRSASFEPNGETARLIIADQQLLDALKLSLSDENLGDSGISIEMGDPDHLAVGQNVTLRVLAPRTGLGKLAKDIDHLLQIDTSCLEEPNRYYLIKEKFAKDDAVVPETVLRYRKLLDFVALLRQCADYVDQTAAELIFLRDGKFIVPVKFKWSQIANIDLKVVERFLGFFNDDTHKEQKISILTNAVLGLVEIATVGRRFPTILTELDDLLNKFAEGYKIFIADFSYDKIRNEFEAFRIDYSGKIHKVFSDIQNQLLAMPVATVIVATSMKSVTSESVELANFAVLIGAWVFSILFVLLCFNQWKTLSALNSEIVRQKKVMAKEYPTIAPSFESVFEWLGKRVGTQYGFLIVVAVVLALGLGSAHYFYFKLIEVGRIEQKMAATQTPKSQLQEPKR